ncbi:di-heme enzyme [Thalassotalea sp. 1_MG-2023]|uniref:MbnH family di-heme enzyme n=1 Tax=Thalassotalea sp. 1_MG-2023 TaxID=3062680 RepID=UPI0026E3D538|nr:MbnH family di-heme enzyme [Thalassotalea sp. 1_MG-2023]MDO6427245.1 di-heme enzyme [Thalassotalea sp. 1_MG-2023]
MKIYSLILIACLLLIIACGKDAKPPEYQWPIMAGFPKPQVPADNPMSEAKVMLGRKIFYDNALSFNQTQSCASCHQQAFAFAESRHTSTGATGQAHRRNALALVNVAYNKTLTWAHDGITSIEQQVLIPMFGEAPIELGITQHEETVLNRFKQGDYPALFSAAFPDESISFVTISQALASFVRSLISLDAPFDQYAYQGEDTAISEAAIRGMNLFFSEKLECHHCHGGFNFTQSTSHERQILDRRPFHNTGLYFTDSTKGYPSKDIGLAEVSEIMRDNGRFRAPTLRNIEVTAPYMHDGSITTLGEVLDFYAAGGRSLMQGEFVGDGRKNPLKSPFVRGFEMTEQDKQDLLAFLATLTDQTFLTNPKFGPPEQVK